MLIRSFCLSFFWALSLHLLGLVDHFVCLWLLVSLFLLFALSLVFLLVGYYFLHLLDLVVFLPVFLHLVASICFIVGLFLSVRSFRSFGVMLLLFVLLLALSPLSFLLGSYCVLFSLLLCSSASICFNVFCKCL